MHDDKGLVLVVDDEPDMCWALQNLLIDSGYRIRAAQTGETAMMLLKDNKFDIALLDAKLTDIEGLDLAQRIKSADSSISIIMISGYYYKEDQSIRHAMNEGLVEGFIAKPFIHEDVVAMLQALGRPDSLPSETGTASE